MKLFTVLTMIFVTAGFTATAGVLSDAQPSPLELSITGSAPSADTVAVGLSIVNHGDQPIVIQHAIEIDRLTNFKWFAQMSVQAVADCTAYDPHPIPRMLVHIEAGATLQVAPWHGWMCGSQCTDPCISNMQLGPGSYQFVVVTAEGKRLPSPSFTVPAQ